MKSSNPQPKKREADGYKRVSTPRQAQRGVSLAAQEKSIERVCRQKGLALRKVYCDRGKSGRTLRGRPELEKAIQAVCQSRGVLVVYSISRMSRSLQDVFSLSQRLQAAGAELVSVTEPIDTTTAMGRAFFLMAALFAQLESEITGERIAESNAYTVAKLGYRRQGMQPLGYRLSGRRGRRGARVKSKREQTLLKRIRIICSAEPTYVAMARALNRLRVPTYTRVRKYKHRTSGQWSSATLAKMMPRIAPQLVKSRKGKRSYRYRVEEVNLFGTATDSALADKLGRDRTSITKARRKKRIVAFAKYRPKGSNRGQTKRRRNSGTG